MNAERTRSIFRKEFIQMRRDRTTVMLLLGIPVMQLLLFGFAIRQEVRHLPTVVFDASNTQESRSLVERLVATDNFRVRGYVRSYEEAIRQIDRGRARAAVVIPEDYARNLKRARPTRVQVLVDATDPTSSQSAIGSALQVGQRVNVEILAAIVGRGADMQPPVELRVRPLYNPALDSAIFVVPGLLGIILSNILIIVTAMAIVREREHGTLEQLIVTPLQRSEIMLGKIAPYVLVGLVQITAVLLVGHFLFRVPIRGGLLMLYAASLIFIVANLGLGLLISTVARNQSQAMQVSVFILLPNMLLSGFMFPREAMPEPAQWIGMLLPLTYFLQVIRGIVLKGVGLIELWPQMLALIAFAALFFTFSTLRFQKQLE